MSCTDCPYLIPSDGDWPPECAITDREVLPDPDWVPCWCPRSDECASER
jgi:hypothetical protein